LLAAAAAAEMKGYLGYTEEPIASADIIGATESSVVDAALTTVVGRCLTPPTPDRERLMVERPWTRCHICHRRRCDDAPRAAQPGECADPHTWVRVAERIGHQCEYVIVVLDSGSAAARSSPSG
jgi:hypothetical protein